MRYRPRAFRLAGHEVLVNLGITYDALRAALTTTVGS
jgi:hypothetical protein